jgi:peptidoglycan hydrolase-like protein with peptidoglycan-binding domain
MNDFRAQVAAIIGGIAANVSVIPAVDGDNRPTLRRGASGKLVEEIQAKVGVPTSGVFDGVTEAAVRQFQRDTGLTPDGIVGPRTWASILGG